MVQPRAEQVINDVEALLALRIIDAANVDETAEAAFGIVAEECEDLDDILTLHPNGEFAMSDIKAKQLRPQPVC
jgi:hypothetical protein